MKEIQSQYLLGLKKKKRERETSVKKQLKNEVHHSSYLSGLYW